jgi:hypothetical protein
MSSMSNPSSEPKTDGGTLRELERSAEETKTIKSEDRRALNEALMDPETINLM